MNIPQLSNVGADLQSIARDARSRQPSTNASIDGTASPRHTTDGATASAAKLSQPNPPGKPDEPSANQLDHAVSELNRAMQEANKSLQFSIDKDTDQLVVKLKDGETGEVIRQIPSDETLAIARYIADLQQGLLLSQKA